MDDGQTTRRLITGGSNNRAELQLCEKGGQRGAKERCDKRCSQAAKRCEAESSNLSETPTEREKFVIKECDSNCTDEDKINGMFGYFCTRCGESDLGSLTDH